MKRVNSGIKKSFVNTSFINDSLVEDSSCSVHFLVFADVTPTSILDINSKQHDLNPNEVLYLPLINAKILENGGYGKIVSVDKVVETKFLPNAKVKDQDQAQNQDPPSNLKFDRQGSWDTLPYHNREHPPTSGSGLNTSNRSLSCSYLNDPSDCLHDEIIYSENYTRIKPATRLVELAEELGYDELDFEGKIEDYQGYQCEGSCGKLFFFPRVGGGSLNPFLAMNKSKGSSKNLVDKFYQLEQEARVLERDKNGDLVERDSNNLYNLCMELTYPHFECNDYFLDLLDSDPDRFYQLREDCINLFFDKVLYLEFGRYSKQSEFIYWYDHHNWKTEDPTKSHFHEHINLLNLLYDWSGSDDFKQIADAIDQVKRDQARSIPAGTSEPHKKIKCTSKEIAEYLPYSVSTVRKKLGFYSGLGLLSYDRTTNQYVAEFPLSLPLIRFNPLRFDCDEVIERKIELGNGEVLKVKKTRKEHYQDIWAECIKEVFGVSLSIAPVVHLPDKIIRLKDRSQLYHRLTYCSRKPVVDLNSFFYKHPKAEIDPDWLDHLLNFDCQRKGSRITKRLCNYVNVEFVSTLRNRLSRLKSEHRDLLDRSESLKEQVYELNEVVDSLSLDDLNSYEVLNNIEGDVSSLKSELKKIESHEAYQDMKKLESKIVEKESLVDSNPVCPVCGGGLSPVSYGSSSDTPLVYYDPIAKKWVLEKGDGGD